MTADPFARNEDLHPPERSVVEAVARALAEDVLADGDITAALVVEDARATLSIVARDHGVTAGQRCAQEAFFQVDDTLDLKWERGDGAKVGPGDVIATVTGSMRSILTAERTALNFLGHLSGVATLTRRYVDAVEAVDKRVRVLDTRKTTPGLRALEKAAVRAGGGHNHRSSLSEAVLVKDNHLGAMTITEAVGRATGRWPNRLVEIECDRIEQVDEACRAGAGAVLLDNMTPDQARECVALARSVNPSTLIEVSGGITLETAPRYAAAGVDLISVGALTHSVPVFDMGLDLTTQTPRGI